MDLIRLQMVEGVTRGFQARLAKGGSVEAGQFANEAEFADFARTAYRSLLRTARPLTGGPHAAEDLVQAALVRVYLRWERASTWESPHAYTRKVVVNLYATWRRRRRHTEVPREATRDTSPGATWLTEPTTGLSRHALSTVCHGPSGLCWCFGSTRTCQCNRRPACRTNRALEQLRTAGGERRVRPWATRPTRFALPVPGRALRRAHGG
jgi:hypothetical protein